MLRRREVLPDKADKVYITETLKNELKGACARIAKILGVRQGSVEIHCYRGEPKQVHVHDKSIKFEEPLKLPKEPLVGRIDAHPGRLYKQTTDQESKNG